MGHLSREAEGMGEQRGAGVHKDGLCGDTTWRPGVCNCPYGLLLSLTAEHK